MATATALEFAGEWVGETMGCDMPAHVWEIRVIGDTLMDIHTRWEDKTEVEPIKKTVVEPRPRLDPKSEQCKTLRDKVSAARNSGNFHDMLRLLNDRECWASKAEHGKLRTLAFKELGKFRECARAGQNNTDPEVVRWVKLCERRAESG